MTAIRKSDITFTARTGRDIRREMLRILAADLAADTASGTLEDDGAMRHGVFINGRHVGYQAIVANGRARLDFLASLDRPIGTDRIRSTAELRAEMDGRYTERGGVRKIYSYLEDVRSGFVKFGGQ